MGVSQCGGVPKSISFLKWTMFRGFGDLEFWNIPISYFFHLFWTPDEAVWCCANNGQLDNSLDIYVLTYYLNHHYSGVLSGNTMSLLLLSSNFHVFPQEPKKNSPHPRDLSRPLPSCSRSHCRQTWIAQKSETSHQNAFPARRTSMVVRMLTMPTTTSDDGHIFGKVSGCYSYIGPTFLTLSERRMHQPNLRSFAYRKSSRPFKSHGNGEFYVWTASFGHP